MNETRDIRSEGRIKPLKAVVELHLAIMTDEDLLEEWKLGNTLRESLCSELRRVERIKGIIFTELDKRGKNSYDKKETRRTAGETQGD